MSPQAPLTSGRILVKQSQLTISSESLINHYSMPTASLNTTHKQRTRRDASDKFLFYLMTRARDRRQPTPPLLPTPTTYSAKVATKYRRQSG